MGNSVKRAESDSLVTGSALVSLPSCLKSRMLWSIGEAEKLKGSAPITTEVVVVFQMNYTNLIKRGYLAVFMQNLYREDLFYADREFTVWSLTGPDGSKDRADFRKFSERF